MLETVLAKKPRKQAVALILAEAALAQALGWKYLVPLLASGLKPHDLRQTGDDLRLACHRAVIVSAAETTTLATNLARSGGRLQAVAPKLRAKGAGEAVALFLKAPEPSPL